MGVSPYLAIANRRIRTKLDEAIPVNKTPRKQDEEINIKDAQYKSKMKQT